MNKQRLRAFTSVDKNRMIVIELTEKEVGVVSYDTYHELELAWQ